MTTITMNPGDDGASLFFQCEGHAGDHDVCTMISTLVNELVIRCDGRYDIREYESGKVLIMGDRCDVITNIIARAVLETLQEIEKQYPDNITVRIE